MLAITPGGAVNNHREHNMNDLIKQFGTTFMPIYFTIAENEIGLLFNHKTFDRVLTTGHHRLSRFRNEYTLQTYTLSSTPNLQQSPEILQLAEKYPAAFADILQPISTTTNQIALIRHKNTLFDVQLPACERFIWKSATAADIELLNIENGAALSPELWTQIRQNPHIHKRLDSRTLLTSITVPAQHIALHYIDQAFTRILPAGKYAWWTPDSTMTFTLIDLQNQDQIHEDSEIPYLAKKYPQHFHDTLHLIHTNENQIALAECNGILFDALPPAFDGYLWRNDDAYHIDILEIEDTAPIERKHWQRIQQSDNVSAVLNSHDLITTATVPAQHLGLLYINQQFTQTYSAGEYAWWTLGSKIDMLTIDLRLQNMDVSGQEILTKDRVSIRLNLLATWQITDAEKLILQVKNYNDYLYREMQLALRTVVATKTLDELLADKNLLNDEIKHIVLPIAAEQGIAVHSVGVKDVILPGDMKDILSQVVAAQKQAEANNIKLREETQSTRSLHNTAKMMENNPMLLRLKELEALEKITTRINQLNVYGGLHEVMHNLIQLNSHPDDKES